MSYSGLPKLETPVEISGSASETFPCLPRMPVGKDCVPSLVRVRPGGGLVSSRVRSVHLPRTLCVRVRHGADTCECIHVCALRIHKKYTDLTGKLGPSLL